MQFIEGGIEGDADSGDEEAESFKFDEMDTNVVEQHLHMSDDHHSDSNRSIGSRYCLL